MSEIKENEFSNAAGDMRSSQNTSIVFVIIQHKVSYLFLIRYEVTASIISILDDKIIVVNRKQVSLSQYVTLKKCFPKKFYNNILLARWLLFIHLYEIVFIESEVAINNISRSLSLFCSNRKLKKKMNSKYTT
jgi:hypothetical protein